MLPKPEHLSGIYPSQFSDRSVVAAYTHRPPYPPAVFSILTDLLPTTPRTVLDLGCGTGDIARPLAPLVERVDAVDISTPMIALGRTLPGGDDPHLHWLTGRAEEVAPNPPYGLATAGESLHWMEWSVLLPHLGTILAPDAVLAIIGRESPPPAWGAALLQLLGRYSTNRVYRPYDLVEELVQRRLFTPLGEARTEPVILRQPLASFVESVHSRNGFSRNRMEPEQAAAFDRELTALVTPFVTDGELVVETFAHIRWGRPHAPAADASLP